MNKTVLITGSSRGIGKQIAREFANNNYNVIINYNNSKNEAEKLEKELIKKTKTLLVKADVSNDDEVKKMFEKAKQEFGKIDVLINNAGIAIDTTFDNKTKENFMHTLEVNLYGTYNVSRISHKYLNSNGTIINISSNNGIDQNYPESCDYDASKAGIISLTHNLSKEYAPIRVNCICPGWVDTEMNKELDEKQIKKETEKILLKRFGTQEEIANVCLFLASEKASYINNTIIRVDGGIK